MSRKSHLCIGGPKAGQRIAVSEECAFFKVAIRQDYSILDYPREGEDVTMPSVKYVEYVEQDFLTDKGTITFWVPSTQDSGTTLLMLAEGYENAHSKVVSK